MILCIETATSVCSVALCDRERVVAAREDHEGKSHAALLTVFIEELFREQDITASQLEAVAVSKGPGSFTGLRIGVSVAKGIAYRAGVPLIATDTLLSMFHGMHYQELNVNHPGTNLLYCPMLDARRMEVYYSLFNSNGDIVRPVNAAIIDSESFMDIPLEKRILFFGNGAGKCEEVIKRENVAYDRSFNPSATFLRVPAYLSYTTKKFEDIAYFEPFYLKDFIATIPRKSITGQ